MLARRHSLLPILLLAAVLAPAVASPKDAPAAAPLESLLTLGVDGDTVIEPDGSVSEFRAVTEVAAPLRELLGRAVRKWRFEPVLVDGKPQRAVARTRLTLAATQTGKDYQVRIDNVVFPRADGSQGPVARRLAIAPLSRQMAPPRYPTDLMRAGVSGRVLLGLRAGLDGRTVEVVALQSMLFNTRGHERNLSRAIEQFERAAVAAARDWRFDVVVMDAAPPTPGELTAVTPVDFVIVDHPLPKGKAPPSEPMGQWRLVSRTPRKPIPWLVDAAARAPGVADVKEGEVFLFAETPKLRDPVVGTQL